MAESVMPIMIANVVYYCELVGARRDNRKFPEVFFFLRFRLLPQSVGNR